MIGESPQDRFGRSVALSGSGFLFAVSGYWNDANGDKAGHVLIFRYNMQLSNQRAEAVKKMLVALGMDPARISTFGYGETDLAVPTDDNVLESKNRRVEVVVN